MTSTTATKEDKKKFANLIGPTEPKVDREVRELLITARVGLLLKASFFGNLATRLKLVNAAVDKAGFHPSRKPSFRCHLIPPNLAQRCQAEAAPLPRQIQDLFHVLHFQSPLRCPHRSRR